MKIKKLLWRRVEKTIKYSPLIIVSWCLFDSQISMAQSNEVAEETKQPQSILKKPIEFSFLKNQEQDSTKKTSDKYKVKISGVLQVHFQHEFNTIL